MKTTKNGFAPIILVIIVALLVAIGGGIYYKTSKTNTPKNTDSSTHQSTTTKNTSTPKPVKTATSTSPIKNTTSVKLDDSAATTAGVSEIVKNNNSFAIKLFSDSQIGGTDKNAFISPWSISSALGMTLNGAKGQTATDMKKVLSFSTTDTVRNASFARISKIINTPSTSYELRNANALWAENSYTFLPAYFTTVAKYYGGNVTNLDFKNKSEESRVTINNWVAKQTNNKIKDLLSAGTVNNSTRLILTNAIYFKGKWENAFEKKLTQDANFFSQNQVQCFRAPCPPITETVKVRMMNKTKDQRYFENTSLQAIELPYKGGNLSMVVLLPKKVNGSYVNILNTITKDNTYLDTITQSLNDSDSVKKVNLFLPKFTFKNSLALGDVLKSMGMEIAFSAQADFSLMSSANNLSISDVVHQAFIAVDEEGTEAAAATGVIMSLTSVAVNPEMPVEFRADHPFLFLIKEKTTGQILFVGKVNNPNK